jgi:hypothetical protein
MAKPRDWPKLRGLNSSRGGKLEVRVGVSSESSAANFARGPSGCMLSAVLVVRDMAISIVLKIEV